MTLAIEMGIAPDDFWRLTPREFSLHARACARRAETGMRRALAIAWHAAALIRVERFPALHELLERRNAQSRDDLDRRAAEHDAIVAAMEAAGTGKNRKREEDNDG